MRERNRLSIVRVAVRGVFEFEIDRDPESFRVGARVELLSSGRVSEFSSYSDR